jgi:tripartite-type tricarboxylate transporter receptor subunit TctC
MPSGTGRFWLGMTAALCMAPAPAIAADYYAGKTINFVVGGHPGGGFDIYSRTLARHLGDHIPGKPATVVKDLPGAGSTKAGIEVSTILAKDGLTIGMVTPGAIAGPLLGGKTSRFAPAKALWLGTANSSTRTCMVYKTSKIKTFADTLMHKTVVGGAAHGDAILDYAYLVKHVTGAALNVVAGYKGTPDATLAMERGEIDGICGWDYASAKAQKPDWIKDGRIRLLLQIGTKPDPELTERAVPQLWKFVKGEKNRRVAEFIVSQQAFQRPFFVAPGTSMRYVAILRKAFSETMADPQFLADAKRMRIDINPLPGTEVQDLVAKFYATPKNVVEAAKQAIRQ